MLGRNSTGRSFKSGISCLDGGRTVRLYVSGKCSLCRAGNYLKSPGSFPKEPGPSKGFLKGSTSQEGQGLPTTCLDPGHFGFPAFWHLAPCGSLQKWGPQNRSQYTLILCLRTLKKGPSIKKYPCLGVSLTKADTEYSCIPRSCMEHGAQRRLLGVQAIAIKDPPYPFLSQRESFFGRLPYLVLMKTFDLLCPGGWRTGIQNKL